MTSNISRYQDQHFAINSDSHQQYEEPQARTSSQGMNIYLDLLTADNRSYYNDDWRQEAATQGEINKANQMEEKPNKFVTKDRNDPTDYHKAKPVRDAVTVPKQSQSHEMIEFQPKRKQVLQNETQNEQLPIDYPISLQQRTLPEIPVIYDELITMDDTTRPKSNTCPLLTTRCRIVLCLIILFIVLAGIVLGVIYLTNGFDLRREEIVVPPTECPREFVNSTTTQLCYKIITELYNWEESGRACRQLHPAARLVVITNTQEQAVINNTINSLPQRDLALCNNNGYTNFYTSGQRKIMDNCTSSFVWRPSPEFPETEVANVSWLEGEPNCSLGLENCLVLRQNFRNNFNDIQCRWQACPICQIIIL